MEKPRQNPRALRPEHRLRNPGEFLTDPPLELLIGVRRAAEDGEVHVRDQRAGRIGGGSLVTGDEDQPRDLLGRR